MANKWIVGCFYLLAFCLATSCSSGERVPQLPKLSSTATILAFGDSLTYGKGVREEHSYPRVLSALVGRKVIRSGIPGEVSGTGLKRLPAELDKHSPDLVVLIHGGNDILQRQSANSSYNNLKRMVELIRGEGISVVLIGVPGFSLGLSSPSAAPQYKQVASELKVPYDDESLPELLHDKSFKSDAVHLNKAGYKRLAEAVSALLEKAGAV